jgi:choline transport protein
MTTAFGAITIGSKAAFSDLVGSFVILSTTSYALAIGGHLFSGRKNLPKGPFWMGKYGYVINGLAFVFIIFFNIIFCFPYSLPIATPTMNYNSVILAGVTALTAFWWAIHGLKHYPGPKLSGFVETEEGRRLSSV